MSTRKRKTRRASSVSEYLKDPAIQQLHNDTLELYRRTYGMFEGTQHIIVSPSGRTGDLNFTSRRN